MSNYLSKIQLKKLGFTKIGNNPKISKKISCYDFKGVLGNNVRVDDDVVFKGKVFLKNNVHIARGCTFSAGRYGIFLDDFVSISNYVQLFTSSDNYTGSGISGGTLNSKQKKIFSESINGPIKIGKLVIVGAFSLILPRTNINDFSSIGAYSILHKKIKNGIYFSNNGKKIIVKKRNIKELESKYIKIKNLLKIK